MISSWPNIEADNLYSSHYTHVPFIYYFRLKGSCKKIMWAPQGEGFLPDSMVKKWAVKFKRALKMIAQEPVFGVVYIFQSLLVFCFSEKVSVTQSRLCSRTKCKASTLTLAPCQCTVCSNSLIYFYSCIQPANMLCHVILSLLFCLSPLSDMQSYVSTSTSR